MKKEDKKTKGVCCKSFNFYVALLYKQRPLSDYSNHRKMPSRSRSRSRSIVAVRKNGKVTNFYKMVTTTTKAGKKTRVPRFLPRSKWPRSKSQLRALGVKESYSQIVKNNESSLRKGRAKRRSNTKRSTSKRSKSKSKSRSRSSPKKSRSSKSKRKSRKSKKRSSSRGVSKSERSFRKKYYNKDSSVSGHSSHSPIPTPPPRPSVSSSKKSGLKYKAALGAVDPKFAMDALRKHMDSISEISGGSAQRRRNRRSRRAAKRSASRASRKSRRSARRSARKSRRSARKSRRSAKRSASRQRRSASRKSRRSARRSARKASRSASRSRRSARRSARKASRSARRGRKASVTGAKVSRSHKSHKSRTGASASKKGAAWIKKKNTALKYLMRRDYGRVLSRAEFMDLPESVRTELQKQAYERAFPAVADRTPEHLLSHEGRAKRATRKEKERVAKSKSRSGRRIRKYVTSSP